jgi:uncharacterized protein
VALPTPSSDSTCLVTGASSGIGAEIARELAGRGHGLTLVARREERLEDLAGELSEQFGVRAETVGCDVADPAARAALPSKLRDLGLRVEVLVNNAGYGSSGRFQELDPDAETAMVRVNVEAVVALCGEYVPGMVERGTGAVLNVASIAAFQPLPGQATYAATKAFVLSFTDALHADLHGTGVTATALCPGPVHSEFAEVAGVGEAPDRTPSFVWMTADEAAKSGVQAMVDGHRVVVPGLLNQAAALGGQHVPRGLLLLLARRINPFT